MKIYNIEAVNMGADQQEIADFIYNELKGKEFASEDEINQGALITQACKALGWNSVPQVGGIVIEWDEQA